MKKEWILTSGTLLLTLLVTLILIETFYWYIKKENWVAPGLQFDQQLGWANIPNLTYSHAGFRFSHNSLGFRAPEPDNSKEQILLIGDSVTYGVGLNDDQTISAFLDLEFSKYQVLNLGVNGFGIDQYYLLLERYLQKLNPRYVVIIIYTGNDMIDTGHGDLFGIGKPFFSLRGNILTNQNPVLSRFDCPTLWSRTWLSSLIGKNRLKKKLCHKQEMDLPKAKKIIKILLAKIEETAKAYGAQTLFVTSPTQNAVKWAHCNLRKSYGSCETYNEGFQTRYLQFINLLEPTSYELLDFENELLLKFKKNIDSLASFYNHNGEDIHHYSHKGTKLIAQSIATKIRGLPQLSKNQRDLNSQENQAINLISKAWTLFIDGNIEKARNLLENSFFPETAYPIRYFLSGKIYTKLGLMDEAIDAFQKLVQLEPNRELNHNLLGTAWLKIGENDNALNSFRKAVAIEPDYPDAYFNLALIYDKFKDGNKALSNLLLAQKLYLKRKNQNLYSLTSQLIEKWGSRYELNRKEIDKKLPTVDEIVELSKINMLKNRVRLSPKNIYWRQRLGMAFIKRSDFKSAISEFKNSIQLFPQNAIAYSHLGFSWFRLENYEMARQSFKKAIKINPKLAMSHFNLGATMDILGDGTFAIKHTKVALKLLESENKKRAIEIANANAQLVQLYKKYGRNPEKSLTKKSFDNLK